MCVSAQTRGIECWIGSINKEAITTVAHEDMIALLKCMREGYMALHGARMKGLRNYGARPSLPMRASLPVQKIHHIFD